MGDIGDGDPDDVAAGVFRIVIGMGVHGVVMVPRVRRIDGDQRHIAQVRPPGKACGLARVRLRHRPRRGKRRECHVHGSRSG
jgi:hypothetical protein